MKVIVSKTILLIINHVISSKSISQFDFIDSKNGYANTVEP